MDRSSKVDTVEFVFLKSLTTSKVSRVEFVIWEYFVMQVFAQAWVQLGLCSVSFVCTDPLSLTPKEKRNRFSCLPHTHNVDCRKIKVALVCMFHV